MVWISSNWDGAEYQIIIVLSVIKLRIDNYIGVGRSARLGRGQMGPA